MQISRIVAQERILITSLRKVRKTMTYVQMSFGMIIVFGVVRVVDVVIEIK